MYITLNTNYPPLARGARFRVLKTGGDWFLVSAHGKNIYVPSDFADSSSSTRSARLSKSFEEELDSIFFM